MSLTQPTCPVSRTNHLVNATVYEDFPSLEQSPTCYGIVACNPKESCLGNNECAPGYEYNKYRCEAYNQANPDMVNCTSDDQCRSRSGTITASNGASSGLSSACAFDKPEDCSRCVFSDPGSNIGHCECMGGGLDVDYVDSVVVELTLVWRGVEGFYRLNDECQCPGNPGLLIRSGLGIVAFCHRMVAQDKRSMSRSFRLVWIIFKCLIFGASKYGGPLGEADFASPFNFQF